MSQAYLAGVRENLRRAEVTFDRYHVKEKLSEAIDTVRRAEAKEHKELLKNTRYLWLKRPKNLTAKQQAGAEVRHLLRARGRRLRGVPASLGGRGQSDGPRAAA